ncbi:hypothetical protein SEA_TUKTUK_19 [Microbacterium phage TukTuk]|uniref:hypothetical protein n=1 Tax=Microbacterium phage BubbaBear TaxID=2572529 RepID=UPI0010C40E25|nr:hypothetical protein QDW44_gp19 [Microbacterium phage BubbaBear]QCG77280.1 hypothetical protein SEA_BUBBABEAR_19 [Microbacterium phage BubbaBear]WNM67922.1 hypothetical protein SEA_ALBEDO_19 [Microbacterium phage Albedo]
MADEELTPILWDATCRTDGCENADITFRVPAHPETPMILCGPCGTLITDLTPSPEGDA